MLTKTDISNLTTAFRQIFATKEDLGTFATKEDLGTFATKDDLGTFATKDDLNGFATKDDLDRFASKGDFDRFATKDDLRGFATKDDFYRFATKDDFNLLSSQVQTIAIDMKEVKERVISIDNRDLQDSNAFARTAVSHDKRLKRIEKILKIKNIHPA